MNQLPPLKINRPLSIPTNSHFFKTENDDTKLPPMKNYDIAIEYYSKGIDNNKKNILFLIKRAICYLGKGYYTLALKDALKAIEIDPYFSKGYYIAAISYLEMYDLENAERYIMKDKSKVKNQRLLNLLDKNKKDIRRKCQKFKLYSKYLFFLKELYKYDSFFPKLDIHFYSDDSRGVVAKANIIKKEIIMMIPQTCLISLENALETDIGKKIGEFMNKELHSPKHSLLSAFLLSEEKNEKWKFYFDLLPKDFSNFPIFYTNKELEYLKGSPFLNQIYEKKIELKLDYEKICEHIPQFAQFSFLKFIKARMLIGSRIFGVEINNKTTDVLAPFADLLNHKRPKQTHWYYDNKLNAFVIQALENIKEGDEIYDSYGPKTNTRFLLNYGFALETNDNNEYSLRLTFNENVPLYEIKKHFLNSDYNFTRTFKLHNNLNEGDIFDLMSFLRFMLFDGEVDELYNAINESEQNVNEDYSTNFFYLPPISADLEIKMLKYLSYLCREALSQYPSTIEEDKNLLKTKKNLSFNIKNCLYLIISEKTVLRYYTFLSEYCLELFDLSEDEIIRKMNKDFPHGHCYFHFYVQEVLLKLINLYKSNDNSICV